MRSFATLFCQLRAGLNLRDVSTFISVIVFVALVSLTGCGGSESGGVKQTTQTITFTQPTSPVTYAPGLTIALSATGGGSGNAVTFTVNAKSTGSGTIAGTVLTVTAAGKLIIDANQAGNSNYYAASQVQVSVVVNKATPTISTPPTATSIKSGEALSSSQLSGGATSVPGVFAWTDGTIVPKVGTDSESVTFTPTDTTDYTTTTVNVPVVVTAPAPQITGFTIAGSQYVVLDSFDNDFLPFSLTGENFESTDFLSLPAVASNALILNSTSTEITGDVNFNSLDFEPEPVTATDNRAGAGGQVSNQWSAIFLGTASQSTLKIGNDGTQYQIQQTPGQIATRSSSGTIGILFSSNIYQQSPVYFDVDDLSGNIAFLWTGNHPAISVYDKTGAWVCSIIPSGMSEISSIAAKGAWMAYADPVENTVGMAKMDCSEIRTVPIAGQPWSLAMVGGDVDVVSRDDAGNGTPRLTKINVSSGVTEGSVDLPIPTVTSVRATTPYQGTYQVAAFNSTSVAVVMYMSDKTDGIAITVSTDTSNGKSMSITYTTAIPDLPVALAAQETGSVTKPIVWIGYIPADAGGDTVNVGALDPATGDYTPALGACEEGLIGGFAASANGLQCAGDVTIGAPLDLPYSSY